MRFNDHISIHCSQSVFDWGSYWLNNTYTFEDENRKILLMKNSPTHVATQLAKKFLFKSATKYFESRFKISNSVQQFKDNFTHKKVNFFVKSCSATLIGQGILCNLSSEEISKLLNKKDPIHESKIFHEMIFSGKKYTSVDYKREKKTDNTYFKRKNGDYGRIRKILYVIDSEFWELVIVIYENLIVKNQSFMRNEDVTTDFFKELYSDTERPRKIRFSEPIDIEDPCMCLTIQGKVFLNPIPFGCIND